MLGRRVWRSPPGCSRRSPRRRQPLPQTPRAIIVLVDNVSFAEVAGGTYPGFAALSRLGSVGLSTVPLGAGGHNAAAYATIGNGTPVPVRAALPELSNGFEATETVEATTAAAAYARNTGTPTTAQASLNPDIVAFTDAFTRGGGGSSAGGLGSSLRAAGLSAALIGNADGSEPDEHRPQRDARRDGWRRARSTTGAVGASVVATDLAAPLGVRTDFERLARADAARARGQRARRRRDRRPAARPGRGRCLHARGGGAVARARARRHRRVPAATSRRSPTRTRC